MGLLVPRCDQASVSAKGQRDQWADFQQAPHYLGGRSLAGEQSSFFQVREEDVEPKLGEQRTETHSAVVADQVAGVRIEADEARAALSGEPNRVQRRLARFL